MVNSDFEKLYYIYNWVLGCQSMGRWQVLRTGISCLNIKLFGSMWQLYLLIHSTLPYFWKIGVWFPDGVCRFTIIREGWEQLDVNIYICIYPIVCVTHACIAAEIRRCVINMADCGNVFLQSITLLHSV